MTAYSGAAHCYDLLYHGKDYRGEAAVVAGIVRARAPHARTVLDVACGTGRHAAHLAADHGFRTDGIDAEPPFVDQARARNPAGTFHCEDMRRFDLHASFDAVICLFGSIGYARDEAGLRQTIAAMARHLAPGGVLVVEPWFEPGAVQDGHVTCLTAEGPGTWLCRMSRTEVRKRVSVLHFEYLVGRPDAIEHVSERHELGLFTRGEMVEAIRAAELTVEFDPQGLTGRGLYVACRSI
jgi:SAM-dependent methyltransferase